MKLTAMQNLAPLLAVLMLFPGHAGEGAEQASGSPAAPVAPGLPDPLGPATAPDGPVPLVISRGEGRVPLVIPRDEKLVFSVSVDLGVLGSPKIGEVAILSKVDPFHVFGGPESEAQELERGSVTAIAVGQYAFYEVREELSTQIMPQDWPHFIYRKNQTGTENRRRELKVGLKDDVYTASFRSDTHCDECKSKKHFVSGTWPWQEPRHCKDCKRGEHRIWRDPKSAEVTPGSLDMLSATMVARALVAKPEGTAPEQLHVLSKLEVWDVSLTRGERKRQTVKAGKFSTVLISLEAVPPPEEEEDGKQFSGLFGIHGSISMWFDEATGVPVLIEGSVPAGPISLDVRIELQSYSGAPAGFGSR